jgi:hypothetical protein
MKQNHKCSRLPGSCASASPDSIKSVLVESTNSLLQVCHKKRTAYLAIDHFRLEFAERMSPLRVFAVICLAAVAIAQESSQEINQSSGDAAPAETTAAPAPAPAEAETTAAPAQAETTTAPAPETTAQPQSAETTAAPAQESTTAAAATMGTLPPMPTIGQASNPGFPTFAPGAFGGGASTTPKAEGREEPTTMASAAQPAAQPNNPFQVPNFGQTAISTTTTVQPETTTGTESDTINPAGPVVQFVTGQRNPLRNPLAG